MTLGLQCSRLSMIIAMVSAVGVVPIAAAQQPNNIDVIASLRAVQNGLTTVEALNLPPSFLQHVADGEIRGSFRAAARKVAADPAPPMPVAAADAVPPMPGVDVRTSQLPGSLTDLWTQYSFTVPNIAGFRAPLGALADNPCPFDLQQKSEDAQAYREAAVFVAGNLAREGLIKTTMRLMSRSSLEFIREDQLNLNRLRAVGVPVDLFAYFGVDGQPVDAAIIQWLKRGGSAGSIDDVVRRARFDFKPSAAPGFHVLAEDGSESIGMLRLQMPTHRYRLGEGDGSVVDVFRQLSQRLPEMPMWVSMHEKAMPTLLRALSVWKVTNPSRVTFVPHPTNITQWAQDNGKAGSAPRGGSDARGVITLAPRFASRTELRTTFVPSDSFVMESLSRAGQQIVQSPLLFQGGTLLPTTDPRNGMRLLLVGEAEIHRNVALGLTPDQVQQAFAVEFGVSRVIVMPAVSFHIDLDVTIRQCNGELVACVNDDLSASRIIYSEGLKSLVNAGTVPSELAAQFEAAQSDEQRLAIMNRIMLATRNLRTADNSLSEKFTACFARSPLESPAANAQRFLVAADTLLASYMSEKDLTDPSLPPPLKAYVLALKRQQLARETLAKKLTDLGMRVIQVPGLNDHDVSINYVNGIHLPGVYLMPTFGGWFEPLDRAASQQLQQAFGPSVNIVPIMAGMVQESDGGLHCMIGLYPAAH